MTIANIYKVLPFEVAGEKVPGHEIARYSVAKSPIKFVVFNTFDEESGVSVDQLIQYQNFTKWEHKTSYSGSVKAVVLEDGTRIHAQALSVGHVDDESYRSAPVICRNHFKVTTLDKSQVLLEVVGVGSWSRSKRDAAATEKFLGCPWERDNKIHQENLSKRLAS